MSILVRNTPQISDPGAVGHAHDLGPRLIRRFTEENCIPILADGLTMEPPNVCFHSRAWMPGTQLNRVLDCNGHTM